MKPLLRICALAVVLIAVTACTVKTDITLETPARGRASTQVTMSPLLRRYLSDLAEVQGTQVTADTSFFDTPALTKAFSNAEGIDLVGILQSTPETLGMLFTFPDIEKLFPKEISDENQPVIRRGKSGTTQSLTIRIDKNNVQAVVGIVPFGNDPISQTITGIFQSGGDENELRDMLTWVFEEYAPAEEIGKMIDSAGIVLTLHVPGTLIKVDGGVIRNSSTAEFRIPLIRFLSLDPPVEYRLTYSP